MMILQTICRFSSWAHELALPGLSNIFKANCAAASAKKQEFFAVAVVLNCKGFHAI
jgi:hypothetical protein